MWTKPVKLPILLGVVFLCCGSVLIYWRFKINPIIAKPNDVPQHRNNSKSRKSSSWRPLPLSKATAATSSKVTNRRGSSVTPTEVRRVLVLGYFRSGSTLTGQIFNYNAHVFYWFEPLAAVAERFGWVNGRVQARNFYNNDDGSEKQCMRRPRSRRRIRICLPLLADKCRKSNLVATKVIRLHMRFAEQLLESDPQFRLIHLVRDPRGMIESWRKIRGRKNVLEHQMRNVRVMCQRLMTDSMIRKKLEKEYPGRVMMLRYEDLTSRPRHMIKIIYERFLKLPVPRSVIRGMQKQLHAERSNGVMLTQRKNGAETAVRWRQSIDDKVMHYSRNVCKPLLTTLHYKL